MKAVPHKKPVGGYDLKVTESVWWNISRFGRLSERLKYSAKINVC